MRDTRPDFPILNTEIDGNKLIYLDNAETMQMPVQVMAAMEKHQKNYYENARRGVNYLSDSSAAMVEKARAHIAGFIGAQSEKEIIFTSGATQGINLAARSFIDTFVQTGEEILVTQMEHHSNYLPWREFVSGKEGVFVECPVTPAGEVDLDAFRKLIGPRTILVVFTYVSNVTGTVNPIKEMTEIAHNAGAAVLIDCAQAMRYSEIDVSDINCDFLVFSGHKFGGPSGTGVLYGKSEMLELMKPACYGGGMVREVTNRVTVLEDMPYKFEAGMLNITGIAGLDAAVSYLEDLGIGEISAKESMLLNRAEEILAGLDRVRILGKPARRAAAVSFDIEGMDCFEAAGHLNEHGAAAGAGNHCALPLHHAFGLEGSVRISPAFYNTEDEIEEFGEILAKLLMKGA